MRPSFTRSADADGRGSPYTARSMTERGMLLVRGLPLRVRGRPMKHGQEGVCVIAAAVQQRRCAQLSYSLAKNKIDCYYAAAVAEFTRTKNNKIINRKTSLCHHRPQTKSHSNEYVNITPKAYRLGAASAGVVGTRTRCCPAATVRAAVVFSCGFRCCFAD